MRFERGVAAITAVLIVAVAASAATFMLAQQSAMVDQAMLVASRAQAERYGEAGLDWARGVLAEDARRAGAIDSLNETWAQPVVGMPIERAVVAGAIVDEQGKFNLNNLVRNKQRSDPDVKIFAALLESLGLAPELADAVVDWIDADSDMSPAGAENSYYLSLPRPYRAANQDMVQAEELYRIRGFDAATVAKLRPYVTALPARTTINVNTASPALLAAALPKMPADELRKRIARRQQQPFASADEFARGEPGLESLDVKSDFFSIRVQVAQDNVQVATEALVQRSVQNGATVVLWQRPLY